MPIHLKNFQPKPHYYGIRISACHMYSTTLKKTNMNFINKVSVVNKIKETDHVTPTSTLK